MTNPFRWSLDLLILAIFALITLFAIIAFLAPDLVAFGAMLVIPYLVLFPAPTAFMYAALFTSFWFTVGRKNRMLGLIAGLLAIAVVGFGLPAMVNARVDREERAITANDRSLSQPIPPTPTVTIVDEQRSLSDGEDPRNGCDFLCESILYSRSATAVVIASPAVVGQHPVTPRLWRMEQRDRPCERVEGGESHFEVTTDAPSLGARIASRAMVGECLTVTAINTRQVGLVLENRNVVGADQPFPWSMILPRPGAMRVSLSRALPNGRSELVGQVTNVDSRRLAVPLRLTIGGSPIHGATWELARERRIRRLPKVDRWLKLDLAAVEYPAPAQLRSAIDHWILTPGAEASQSDETLQNQFFAMVEREPADVGDVGRARALLLDPRTKSASWIWTVARKQPASAQGQFDALLTRLEGLPGDDAAFNGLARLFESAPPAAFRQLNPRVIALLADQVRRRSMQHAISRLGEAGPSAAPLLFSILQESVDRKAEPSNAGLAAISGICRLAPRIAPAYRQLEHIIAAQPGLEQTLTSREGFLWGITRMRLGRPPATITRPGTSNSATWLPSLRADAANGQCKSALQ